MLKLVSNMGQVSVEVRACSAGEDPVWEAEVQVNPPHNKAMSFIADESSALKALRHAFTNAVWYCLEE